MIFITIYHQKFIILIIIHQINHHIIKIRNGKFYLKSGERKKGYKNHYFCLPIYMIHKFKMNWSK